MKRRKGGMAGIVVLVMVIAIAILGGMLLVAMFGSSSADSVVGTDLEQAGQVTETTINIGLQLFPIIIWISVVAVIGLALFFLIKTSRKYGK